MDVLAYLIRPLQSTGLIFIGVFTLLFAIGVQAGLLGLVLLITLTSWFLKYCFVLLDHIADGRPGAPVLSAEMVNPLSEPRPLGYFLIIGGFYGLTAALIGVLDAKLIAALRLTGLVLLPAIIAVHTVTGTLSQALNPLKIVAMVIRLGVAYCWILLAALACWYCGELVLTLSAGRLPFVLNAAALMYLWLALFAILGGAIYERRMEIGHDPIESPERTEQRLAMEINRARDHFIDTLFAEYRSGAYVNAWETVQRQATAAPSALEEYRWISARIAAWPNPRLAHRVAQEMLPLLLAGKHLTEALRLLRSRLDVDPDFRPAKSDALITLVRLARDGGDRPLARRLLADFDRLYPNDPAQQLIPALLQDLAR